MSTTQTTASEIFSKQMALESELGECSPRGRRPNARRAEELRAQIAHLRAERNRVLGG